MKRAIATDKRKAVQRMNDYNICIEDLSDEELEALFVNDSVRSFVELHRFRKNILTRTRAAAEKGDPYTAAVFTIDQVNYLVKAYGSSIMTEISGNINEVISKILSGEELMAPVSDNVFALFLKCSPEEAKERLSESFDELTDIMARNRRSARVTFFCGLYSVDDISLSYDEILEKADAARHSASLKKSSVTEFEIYSPEIYAETVRELQLENDLCSAVEKNELIIEIQPKFDIKTGKCPSAEALVRWNHPTLGRICPDEFIPIAEKTGAVIDIDMFVLETVCKYQRKWMDMGCNPVPVAVNQSRIHITDPDYVENVFALMQKYDVWPNLIILETTESIAFNDYASVTEVLKKLHDYGFILSMDDFGSGYSSLHMLNELEYDELKLDQKILRYGKDAERNSILIRHIIEMAHDMKMTVVAEGVETEEQAEMLKKAGCDIVQGFLYSYPLPIDKFEASIFGMVYDQ